LILCPDLGKLQVQEAIMSCFNPCIPCPKCKFKKSKNTKSYSKSSKSKSYH